MQYSELIVINGEKQADRMFRDHYLEEFEVNDFLDLAQSFYRVILENDELLIFQKTIIEK